MKPALFALFAVFSTLSAGAGGFDVYADRGRLHRLDGASGPNVPVMYRRSDDGGRTWTTPLRIDGGRPAYHFGAGDARVVADGNKVFALWVRAGTGPHDSGPLAAARSLDGGATWAPAASPSGDGAYGRRFPALAISSGTLHAVWLDRRSKSKVTASRSTDGARSWSKPVSLDVDACECCWNSALASADGSVHALYRGRKPRDMDVVVSRDGGRTWSRPAAVGPFDWGFNGCPHVGGALASAGGVLYGLVWTGQDDHAGLYVFASRAGAWSLVARLGGAGAKHADLASSGPWLAAAWDDGGAIWASTSRGGRSWSTPARVSGTAVASHPRVAAAGTGFRVFWSERSGAADAELPISSR